MSKALRRTGKTLVAGAAFVAVFALAGSGQLAALSSTDHPATSDTAAAERAPRAAEGATDEHAKESASNGETAGEKNSPRKPTPGKPKPATGTFTVEQENYADGQVPRGIDPAVIVEAGEEACKKVGWIASVDEEAAIQALADDEINNAPRAIRHLCPEFKPLLKKAGK